MSGPAAPDQEARDRIRDDLDTTLFVEAAAGTGKTTALVERVTRLVASGAARLAEVAAITFTEKAAAELRDRVRRSLTEAAAGPDPDEAARCWAALGELDDAAISTLHAFAQRILARFPLEAGLPPRFEVVDDMESTATFDGAWRRFMAGWLDSGDPRLRLSLALGLRPDDIRSLAQACHDHWDRLTDFTFEPAPLPAVDATTVIARLTEAVEALATCAAPDDLLADHITGLVPVLERLVQVEPGDDFEMLVALAEAPGLANKRGQAGNWGGKDHVERVRALLDAAEAARTGLLTATRSTLVTHLATSVRDQTLDSAAHRRREGRIAFHDLLVLARDLLRAEPSARAALRSRWRYLLIDEFQDTDPLQIELAVLLATDADGPVTGWDDVDVEAGRLFLVGDPKQSIYRFRRADIGLYQRVQERFAAGQVRLHANFRCAGPVVGWVNTVFGELMGAGEAGIQAAYTELCATRDVTTPTVRTLAGPIDTTSVAAVREQEAADVAATVRQVVDEGWAVETGGGAPRPARLADVAILLPTRRLLPELERALAAVELPYRIESRSLLWTTQEVRDLLNVVRAIDSPIERTAVVAALRSPAFGCRDDELMQWRQSGGSWDYLMDGPAAPAVVAEGLARLRGLHEERHWVSVPSLIERVVREHHLVEVQAVRPRPRDHWRRVRFVADQARAFHERGGSTLRAFIDWAEGQASEDVPVNESIVPEGDDDAVAISTVHAAKGLEFPVVVMAGLDSYPPHRRPPILFGDGPPEVALGYKDLGFATAGYAGRHSEEARADTAESARLLYVAATRARDHLVVALHHKAVETRSHAARLVACGALVPDAGGTVPEGEYRLGPAPAVTAAPFRIPDDAAWQERSHLLAPPADAIAATSLAGDLDDEAGESPPWKRGRAGTAFGRAVHAVLQSIDLATGAGAEALSRAQAAAEGVPDRADEIRRAVGAALACAAVVEAVAGDRYWREVFVAADVAGTVVEGFVDLLYEGPDGLVVVDYKTDRVAGGDIDDRYRVQGAAYAAVVAEVLDRPVARCTFVYVGDGAARQFDVVDLDQAVADVRRQVSAR